MFKKAQKDLYKIQYSNGEISKELPIAELIDGWVIVDGLGVCKYFKNGSEITFGEFELDYERFIFTSVAESPTAKPSDPIGAKNASSGDSAKNASSGNSAQNASSGDYAQNASSGNSAKNASSGNSAQNASSGNSAQNASSGNSAKNASSGDYAQNASSGDYAQNASSGNSAKNASSGDSAKNASSGDYAQNASSGDYAQNASSGNSAKNIVSGKNSVCFDCGIGGVIKAVKGTYIALAEWVYDDKLKHFVCVATATAKVDGKTLKENAFYGLYNGKFTEIDFTDNIKAAVISSKRNIKKLQNITDKNRIGDGIFYAVSDGTHWAHGDTIAKAKESLIYKISNRDTSKYKNLKLSDKLTFEDAVKLYRVITGACEYGVRSFVASLPKDKIKKQYTIKEIIELTKGQYGSDSLAQFFRK